MRIKHQFPKTLSNLLITKEYYLILTGILVSVKTFITEHPVFVFSQNFKIPKRFFSHKNPAINYFYKLINTLIEATLLVLAVGILCFLIYNTLGILFDLYLATPMGAKFLSIHPQRAETLLRLTELDLVYFCTEVTVSSFVICFILSAICRMTHISHFLFLSQGLFGKLVYWGAAFTGAVSYYIKNKYGFSSWEVTAVIVMIPTYLMFISCFKYSEKLLPEIGDVLKVIIFGVRQSYQLVYVKINAFIFNFINR